MHSLVRLGPPLAYVRMDYAIFSRMQLGSRLAYVHALRTSAYLHGFAHAWLCMHTPYMSTHTYGLALALPMYTRMHVHLPVPLGSGLTYVRALCMCTY